jgi:hypothetical protein
MTAEDKKDEEIPTFVVYPSARFLDRGHRVSSRRGGGVLRAMMETN